MEYPDIDYKRLVQNIRTELETYLKENNLKALVLGMSGGIDSTITAALAQPVCEKLGVELIGRSIAIGTNKQDEIDRGADAGKAFCTRFDAVDLTDTFNDMVEGMFVNQGPQETDIDFRIRLGNMKARIRMIYLYNLAQKYKGMVLSTDNKTELLLGFWTLHGDVGDYGMIQNLWKTEVYGLANYLAGLYGVDGDTYKVLKDAIDAIPTDGLGVTGSDLEQLGVDTYAEVDDILKRLTEEDYLFNETEYRTNPVIQRHIRTKFKRENPYNIPERILRKGI